MDDQLAHATNDCLCLVKRAFHGLDKVDGILCIGSGLGQATHLRPESLCNLQTSRIIDGASNPKAIRKTSLTANHSAFRLLERRQAGQTHVTTYG
jgi:hypothetical protein